MAVIRISEAGLSLGVQIDTDLTYHLRANMSVSADSSIVSIFDGEELIVSGHTTEFLIPKEESVADLLPKIQLLIDAIFIDDVSKDVVDALNGANNPSASNVFVTISDLDVGKEMKFSFAIGAARSNTASYEVLARFDFDGSTAIGVPTFIKAIAYTTATNYDIRIYDVTNALVIAEQVGKTNVIPAIFDMGALNNIPTAPSIWEVQLLRNGGGFAELDSLSVKFN